MSPKAGTNGELQCDHAAYAHELRMAAEQRSRSSELSELRDALAEAGRARTAASTCKWQTCSSHFYLMLEVYS